MSQIIVRKFARLFVAFIAGVVSVLFSVLVLNPAIQADVLTYPGDSLATAPSGYANSLFPATSWSNNIVTVNASGVVAAYGAIRFEVSAGQYTVQNNLLTIQGGSSVTFGIGGHLKITDSAGDNGNVAESIGNTVYFIQGSSVFLVYGGYAVIDCNTSSSPNCGQSIANDNHIFISDSTITSYSRGGRSEILGGGGSTENSNNTITISNSNVGFVYGGDSYVEGVGNIKLDNNTVTIENGSSATQDVIGANVSITNGNGSSLELTNNTVIMNDSTTQRGIYGTFFQNTSIDSFTIITDENTVTMDNSSSTGTNVGVAGVYINIVAGNVEANNSTVRMSNSSALSVDGSAVNISGAGTAEVSENHLFLSGATIANAIHAGSATIASGTAKASNNTLDLSGTTAQSIYIGFAQVSNNGDAEASGNILFHSGTSSTIGLVEGGRANVLGTGTANALGNHLSLNNVNVVNDVTGGYARAGTSAKASQNYVEFNDSVIGGYLYGGEARVIGTGTITQASQNIIKLSGTDVSGTNGIRGGYAYTTGSGTVETMMNEVSIESGNIVRDIIGGSAQVYISGTARASGNSLTLRDVSAGRDIMGGQALVYTSGTAEASGNSLTLRDVSAGRDIVGGLAVVYTNGTAGASGNSLTLKDVIADGEVIGGYPYVDATPDEILGTGNQITLEGTTSLTCSATCRLAGAVNDSPNPATVEDVFTGNFLNVLRPDSGGIVLNNTTVMNFQGYNFLFPASVADWDVALRLTGTGGVVILSDGVSQASVIRSVDIAEGGALPAIGTTLVLIDGDIQTSDGSSTEIFQQEKATGRLGRYVALEYDLDYNPGGGYLYAVLTGIRSTEQSKPLAEAFLSGSILVNQGADLAAGKGLASAVFEADQQLGWTVFSAIEFVKLRHETGSHVDTAGVSLLLGLTKGFDLSSSRLTLGAFVEGGRASFDTHNPYPGSGDVNGEGHAEYLGGGILARLELPAQAPGRPYAEVSARLGRAKNDFASEDMADDIGSYDVSSDYFGFHAGLGYVFDLADVGGLDLGVRYFQSRRKGLEAVTPSGAPVSFEAVDSRRLRVGARLSLRPGAMVSPFLGASWEHEFEGESRGAVYGLAIPEVPSLKGDTGIAELGVAARLSEDLPVTLDIGAQGYFGKRRGFGGGMRLNVAF